jgi:hypothetical protein
MNLQFAQGYNNQAGLAAFPYEPRYEAAVEFDVEFDSSGIARPVGGADAFLIYDYLEYEEAQVLLNYLGLSTNTPSRACTILLPDLYSIPIVYNGVMTIDFPRSGRGWWTDFGLRLSGLEQI